jgi:hypothetical protein
MGAQRCPVNDDIWIAIATVNAAALLVDCSVRPEWLFLLD